MGIRLHRIRYISCQQGDSGIGPNSGVIICKFAPAEVCENVMEFAFPEL